MTRQDIVTWLRRERVETGSLICLGCGHEHACGTKGCAVLRADADLIDRQHESMVNMVRTLVRHQKTIGRLTDEVARLTRDRKVAVAVAKIMPDVCDGDCRGDAEAGIYPCPAYEPPEMDDKGYITDGCCLAMKWRSLRPENSGTEGGGNSVQSY